MWHNCRINILMGYQSFSFGNIILMLIWKNSKETTDKVRGESRGRKEGGRRKKKKQEREGGRKY